jgi:two-component system LytT family sensor kinase
MPPAPSEIRPDSPSRPGNGERTEPAPDPRADSLRFAQDIERWIGSPGRRAILIAALVLACTLGTTIQTAETLVLRKRDFDPLALFVQQLCLWTPWGVVGAPLVVLARSIFRLRRSWLIAALIQIPLSITVAWLFQLYEDALVNVVFLDTWLSPNRPVGTVVFRFARELLVYWLVLASGAAVVSFLRSQAEERAAAALRVREAELSAEIARARLATLTSQLHPHFLFNALHTVGGLVREGETRRALQVLASIGSLLRATLDQGDAQEVPLAHELALAERYLEIERVRFGERLAWTIEVDDGASAALRDTRVPALLLLTLVENSVRHAVGESETGGRIALRARASGTRLRLEVEDDGPGFPPEVLARGTRAPDERGAHIGLDNTRRRLALLYGSAHALALENLAAPGGARVVVELPLAPIARRALAASLPAPA